MFVKSSLGLSKLDPGMFPPGSPRQDSSWPTGCPPILQLPLTVREREGEIVNHRDCWEVRQRQSSEPLIRIFFMVPILLVQV